jgi:hypothetical protein
MRVLVALVVCAGCASDPSYSGTYEGGFFVMLDPSPVTGDPTAQGTITLSQSGKAVTGTFDVSFTSNGQTNMSTGTVMGTVGGNNAIGDFTIVVDMFSPSCTPPQFTAHGQASLGDDRLMWTADGTSTCGGMTEMVSMVAAPGMMRR